MNRFSVTDGKLTYNGHTIPKKVVDEGEQAVREYVRKLEKKREDAQRKREANLKKWGTSPNHPIQFEYDGHTLKGRIVSALDGLLVVELVEPYQGTSRTNFNCFGSAMAGHHIFDEDGSFSEHAINAARRLMSSIYEQGKHRPLHDLADRLNGV